LLLAFSALLTLAIGLGLIRWLAPGLLGVPADLQLVQTSDKVPPFYENVFRLDDIRSRSFILPDPLLPRAKPLIGDAGASGPNDLLGFRNRAIPAQATVVAIGDSQTYGNNAALEGNWPSVLGRELGLWPSSVYGMATGGWSAIEYLYIADKAHALRPRLIIVAFYSGNDPLEAFVRAYGNPNWSEFRIDPSLTAGDAPKVVFPAPAEDVWQADFSDGAAMRFTPTLRYSSIQSHPAVNTGWDIMASAAERIDQMCQRSGIALLLTLIPTKETAMRQKVAASGVSPPAAYVRLVEEEAKRIAWFEERLRALPHGRYVDVVGPLQEAASIQQQLYPTDQDGHPLAAGYALIGSTLAAAVDPEPLRPALGAYAVGPKPDTIYQLRLMTDQGWWLFDGPDTFRDNGWEADVVESNAQPEPIVRYSNGTEFSSAPFLGVIDHANQDRFGPAAVPDSTPTAR
jgi:lysophospholipase L1-like esterase